MSNYQTILNEIKIEYSEILKNNLVGIYVHGSIAFSCFNWDKSDIDFIVVINCKIDSNTKLQLLDCLERLRYKCPPKGLEMSVILKEHCVIFQYPTPYELHYSNSWLNTYLTNPLSMCGNEVKTDKDLAAHFTVIKKAGIVLCGQPIEKVFSDVDKIYYLDSIKNDIISAEEEILENPIYITLNLCRVLAYLKNDLIISKNQGGQWGLINIDPKYSPIIQEALKCYSTNKNMNFEKELALEYSKYILNEIQRYS